MLVLGSATPSLESAHNVTLGKLTRLRLGSRIESRPLPPVELVDLRTVARVSGAHWFGVPLVEAVRDTLARGEQALLFLNRRGFASLVRCGACQEPVLCVNCSLALTWHQGERRLRCHRCDYSRALPETCPACGGLGWVRSIASIAHQALREVEWRVGRKHLPRIRIRAAADLIEWIKAEEMEIVERLQQSLGGDIDLVLEEGFPSGKYALLEG